MKRIKKVIFFGLLLRSMTREFLIWVMSRSIFNGSGNAELTNIFTLMILVSFFIVLGQFPFHFRLFLLGIISSFGTF